MKNLIFELDNRSVGSGCITPNLYGRIDQMVDLLEYRHKHNRLTNSFEFLLSDGNTYIGTITYNDRTSFYVMNMFDIEHDKHCLIRCDNFMDKGELEYQIYFGKLYQCLISHTWDETTKMKKHEFNSELCKQYLITKIWEII